MRGVLFDDRPLVEVGGRIVRRCTDQLDATVVGLAVRVGADERRQERVVDVDDPVGVCGHEAIAQDLHVPRHHHQLDVVLVECGEHLGLLVGLGVGGNRRMQVGHAHVVGDAGVIGVVRHDHPKVHRQFPAAPSGEEVVQTVRLAGGHDRRRGRGVGEAEVDGHPEAFGDRGERVDDLVASQAEAVEVELDTLEEDRVGVAGARVDVLLGVDDVAGVVGEELRRRGNNAGLVGTREQQDGGHANRSTVDLSRGVGRARSTRPLWRPLR